MTVSKAMNKINKRIPGLLLPVAPNTKVDGASDLPSKTIPELMELKDRQLKLLNNKSFINRLADKGAKIQAFYDKITRELNLKQEAEETRHLLEKLNLNIDEKYVQQVEWEGKIQKRKDTYLDSDDDSDPEDILQILSQHTAQEKQVKVLQPEKLLVTPDDLLKIGENPHVKYIVGKTEVAPNPKAPGKFKPYKTTITNVHDPEKEMHRKKNKYWENTAATPPLTIHGPAIIISIEESLQLQKEQNKHLKETESLHAAEKLLTKINIGNLPDDVSKFGNYRDVASDSDDPDPEGSDKEVHDEEPEKGGVVFTVMN
ncbi:Protein GRINL1B [Operophtera brumata]|uniref:Protein GRINL1B n=1 Tax=Operophtera brumata TaxID=104452 RepID=A0A0L7LGT8_OPEBR|nr:Protein GRINL1B [Operophtera brumata]